MESKRRGEPRGRRRNADQLAEKVSIRGKTNSIPRRPPSTGRNMEKLLILSARDRGTAHLMSQIKAPRGPREQVGKWFM